MTKFNNTNTRKTLDRKRKLLITQLELNKKIGVLIAQCLMMCKN
jgi:hypothetical protein